jgi:hypothetical protein
MMQQPGNHPPPPRVTTSPAIFASVGTRKRRIVATVSSGWSSVSNGAGTQSRQSRRSQGRTAPAFVEQVDGDEAFSLGDPPGPARETKGHLVADADARRVAADRLYGDAPVIRALIDADRAEALWRERRYKDYRTEVEREHDAQPSQDHHGAPALSP